MATVHSTDPAAPSPHPECLTDEQLVAIAENGECTRYDRFVSELAALKCVLATLECWDLSGQPTDQRCQIPDAELTLRETIARLCELASDVNRLETLLARAKELVHS
jgi:hypothetical protein